MQYPKPHKQIKNPAYLNFVRGKSCLYCGERPSQAHHVRWAGDCGMGTKPDDYYTIPLCAKHHDLVHNDPKRFGQKIGREETFEAMARMLVEWVELGVSDDE